MFYSQVCQEYVYVIKIKVFRSDSISISVIKVTSSNKTKIALNLCTATTCGRDSSFIYIHPYINTSINLNDGHDRLSGE